MAKKKKIEEEIVVLEYLTQNITNVIEIENMIETDQEEVFMIMTI